MNRRDFLGVAAGVPLLVAVRLGQDAPYGALRPADQYGLMLPAGFTAREIGRAGEVVPGTGYVWPAWPDGGATFARPDRGWIYVANSEVDEGRGSVSAIRFDAGGTIVDASSICTGTSRNCSGGVTPWRTWLTCEEIDTGQVWECNPEGGEPAVVRARSARSGTRPLPPIPSHRRCSSPRTRRPAASTASRRPRGVSSTPAASTSPRPTTPARSRGSRPTTAAVPPTPAAKASRTTTVRSCSPPRTTTASAATTRGHRRCASSTSPSNDDTGGSRSDEGGDLLLPVAGAVGGVAVIALGGLAWLRNRRGSKLA